MPSIKINVKNSNGVPSSATIHPRIVLSLIYIVFDDNPFVIQDTSQLRPFIQDWVNDYNANLPNFRNAITDSESLLITIMQAIEFKYVSK